MDPEMQAARERLAARAGNARTGGKGSVRRKKKAAHKAVGAEDKKLGAVVKRLGVQPIVGVEEANLFKQDGQVIHFSAPKVQASVNSNVYIISGNSENKQLQELLPGVMQQLGTENLTQLRNLATAAGMPTPPEGDAAADNDVPDVDNFEDASTD